MEYTNTVWRCLDGALQHFTAGGPSARRFARGLPAAIAFPDPKRPDFAAIAPFCDPGESFYCAYWTGPVPSDWDLEEDRQMLEMAWQGRPPPETPTGDLLRLGPSHSAAMVALTQLTLPGPFGPRNLELGEYFGVMAEGHLVAMAGERLFDGRRREISAVCTDPAYQGRGCARRLITHLIRRQIARGEEPFLHVMRENPAAAFYERLGFRLVQQVPVRVVRFQPVPFLAQARAAP